MTPIQTATTNTKLLGTSDGVSDLPVYRGQYSSGEFFVESCWQAGWRERLRLLLTGRVYLIALGTTHPPVLLSTTPTPAQEPAR